MSGRKKTWFSLHFIVEDLQDCLLLVQIFRKPSNYTLALKINEQFILKFSTLTRELDRRCPRPHPASMDFDGATEVLLMLLLPPTKTACNM